MTLSAIHLGQALLTRQSLELRAMAMDLLRDPVACITDFPDPGNCGDLETTAAAAVLELLASRSGVEPPSWVHSVPPMSDPMFVVAAAESMPRLRSLCLTDSPEPMRRRGFLAPPDFLTFA